MKQKENDAFINVTGLKCGCVSKVVLVETSTHSETLNSSWQLAITEKPFLLVHCIPLQRACCDICGSQKCLCCRSPGVSQSRTLSSPNRTRWRAAFYRSRFWSWRPCSTCRAYFGRIHWKPTNIFAQGEMAYMYIQTPLPEPSPLSLFYFSFTGNELTDSAHTHIHVLHLTVTCGCRCSATLKCLHR